MRFLKLSFLLLQIIFLSACGKDDENCVQADWPGIYIGTEDCDGYIKETIVTITAGETNDVVVKTQSANSDYKYQPFPGSSCDFSETTSHEAVTVSLDISLEDDLLTIKNVQSDDEYTFTCTLTATRN